MRLELENSQLVRTTFQTPSRTMPRVSPLKILGVQISPEISWPLQVAVPTPQLSARGRGRDFVHNVPDSQ